jgi:uncharacterized protein GlcG (DUF336 family)
MGRGKGFVCLAVLSGVVLHLSVASASAENVLQEKQVSLRLAQDAATAAVEKCRKDGFRVAVTVVDRAGQIKTLLRDDGAGPHTADTSRRKAYTALTFQTSTAELAQRIASTPGAANLKDITDVIALAGGLPIRSGTDVIGGIGVGGAPGGDKDEICAQAGIDAIGERLK